VTDPFTPAERSAVMRKVPSKGSSAELKVRKALTALGARYRLHRKDLPGSPDVVLPGRRLALFVHGCFWHGHDCRRGARPPKANADYWSAKIARNRARDQRVQAELISLGWRVDVLWECELKDAQGLGERLAVLIAKRPGAPLPRA
jgi:DNA mismatch endonuclease (patch repair protein)